MEKDKEFLGREPIGKLLLRLAIPTLVAQLVNMLYNIVDRIYIGHMPENGSLALTGVGVCLPIILIVSAFAALVSSGGAPRATIAMGSGDDDTAEDILGSSLTLLLAMSCVLMVLLAAFHRPLLLLFGASENTIEYAAAYMRIYTLGTIFVQLTLGMNAFITAQGYTKMAMVTVVIGAVTNIILDPIFIYALGMGVRGAALATVLSQALSAVWCVWFLSGKKTRLRIRTCYLHIHWKLILPCLALGTATFIMQASESVISMCFNSSLLKYGGDIAVGAMTVSHSVMQLIMLPMSGIGQGAQPIMSYNFGAGNMKRVRDTFRLLCMCTFGFALVVWSCIMIRPELFASVFTSDPKLIDFTRTALRIYCGTIFLMGIQTACQFSFISIGSAVCSILVAVMRKFILIVPLIYILPHFMANPTWGVFTAEPVSDFLSVAFCTVLFISQFNKALKKRETAAR